LNGGIAAWTVFSGSDLLWSVYNGGISYILIGSLFAGEFIVRKMTDKKMPKAIPLSQFTANSRPDYQVLCYERNWQSGVYKTWKDFLDDTVCIRRAVQNNSCQSWILYADDYWYFLCAFTALLQCGKEVWLSANISPAHIAEIRGEGVGFLCDQNLSRDEAGGEILLIPSILDDDKKEGSHEEPPPINADETKIVMFTSGSTGKPKVIRQRLTEFESDNRFILSRWGEEWLSRKACSTVSPHHIYGLLFSILLPFTAGVPFRRKRIETPENLETLNDESYMLITVPAFLKRAVEFKAITGGDFGLNNVWIFTSGGVLERDVAEKTHRFLGFWPLEVYGSTETSGIAWRFSRDGLEWTPFDNATIRLNEEGCLVIRSPYIKDPAGFTTADLAAILGDGRFFLKGRVDSVVKIEEKRVSLTEVEERLRQSALVSDVCVIAMKDRRQYLVAALVLNDAGTKQFLNWEKFEINRWFREYLARFLEPVAVPKKWRYVQSLPLDSQGKKKKEAIEALFARLVREPNMANVLATKLLSEEKLVEQSAEKIILDFSIPEESDYFDDHFPQLRILPAVAQFELAVRFADRYLGTGLNAEGAKRLKFTAPVLPGKPLRMELQRTGNTIAFTIKSPDGETLFSSGGFTIGNKE
jgi:acyl-CoA synthetase (AMP-forming)/AMP-acid ligase II/3-hydroxymyristoyl/3-hydroxydecanoyl-(acyl carrier protein) dehydratase